MVDTSSQSRLLRPCASAALSYNQEYLINFQWTYSRILPMNHNYNTTVCRMSCLHYQPKTGLWQITRLGHQLGFTSGHDVNFRKYRLLSTVRMPTFFILHIVSCVDKFYILNIATGLSPSHLIALRGTVA